MASPVAMEKEDNSAVDYSAAFSGHLCFSTIINRFSDHWSVK
jgi:hypothetical protein